MKIFETEAFDGTKFIRVQLMNLRSETMIFDFTVRKSQFNEIRDHIIENLLAYKLEE